MSGVASTLRILENAPLGLLSTGATATLVEMIEPKEKFRSRRHRPGGSGVLLIWMINIFVTFFAFVLAFRCIGKGGNAFGHLLGACCCGIIYIAYALTNC